MFARGPKAGHEIFVTSVWLTVLKSYSNNFVASWLRTIPGAFKGHKCITAVFCWELLTVVEHQIQDRRMRLEQHVWNNGGFHFFWRALCETWLRVGPDIRIRPSIKGAASDMREVIRWQIVAESIALLNAGIKFSSNWVKCERSRIAHSRSKRSLARPVCLESLNGGLDLRFHTNVAGRSHAYRHGSGFRIQGEVTVLVSGNCAEHTFLSDQFLTVCREHRLALLWRH